MSRIRVVVLAALIALSATLLATPAVGSTDAFTGAWTATDADDGSTLKVLISSPNVSGNRRVTLMDQFASLCGALATGIGSGTTSGTTLSATLDFRCGGSPIADDIAVGFDVVGDTLVGFGLVWVRTGG